MSGVSRRRFLGAVSVGFGMGLSGCSSSRPSDGPSPPTAGSPTSRRSDAQGTETVRDVPFEFDVVALQSFSETHPARIRISLTNTGREIARIGGGDPLPFAGLYGSRETDDQQLMIVPEDPFCTRLHEDVTDRNGSVRTVIHPIPNTPPGDCWSVDYGQMQCLIMRTASLEPGETIQHTYTVLGYRTDSCLPPGTYQFEDWIVWMRDYEADLPDEELEIVLQFSIHLDESQQISVTRTEPVNAGTME